MASAPAILLFAAFISLFSAGGALRCYQCPERNPQCGDPFRPDESTPLVECIPRVQVCAKNVFSINGQKNVNRGCIMRDLPLPTSSWTSYKCETDGCNSAPQHFSMLPVIISLTAAAYMATKL